MRFNYLRQVCRVDVEIIRVMWHTKNRFRKIVLFAPARGVNRPKMKLPRCLVMTLLALSSGMVLGASAWWWVPDSDPPDEARENAVGGQGPVARTM